MILLETRPTAAECWVLACDVCGHALDPGELDAPDGGWSTQRAAYDAAEARGWQTDVLEVGNDWCPGCLLAYAPDGFVRDDGWPVRYHQ